MSIHSEITEMKDMGTTQLNERLEVVEMEMAAIKSKLARVRAERHATGKWADPDWYYRAETRVRFLGVEHQQLCREIGRRRREEHAATDKAFVNAARSMLSQQEFLAIMGAATGKVAADG